MLAARLNDVKAKDANNRIANAARRGMLRYCRRVLAGGSMHITVSSRPFYVLRWRRRTTKAHLCRGQRRPTVDMVGLDPLTTPPDFADDAQEYARIQSLSPRSTNGLVQ